MTLDGDVVLVDLDAGMRAELHVLALRDACPCSECRHPVSGQRLFESGHVLAAAKAVAARVSSTLEIDWADGHRSAFPLEWVRTQAADGVPDA